VKMGFFGTSSTLIPMDIATVDESRGFIEVSQPKSQVKDGPSFDDDGEITPEYENEVRSYYGLGTAGNGAEDRGTYGDYYGEQHDSEGYGTSYHTGGRASEAQETDEERGERERGSYDGDEESAGHSGAGSTGSGSIGTVGAGMSIGDTESGEFRGHGRNVEGVSQPGSDLEDEDELRVRRSEEELRVGTREREAGAVNVRKRVRTERERMRVPKRREEVSVERIPGRGVAAEGEIGDEEIRMPVVEEEVVVEKRPVVKEELRIRKDVVQDEEVIEADVRREGVDVYDETTRQRGDAGGGTERRDR